MQYDLWDKFRLLNSLSLSVILKNVFHGCAIEFSYVCLHFYLFLNTIKSGSRS